MINFTAQEKERIVAKIKAHFERELNQDIGQFDAEFLLDFFAEVIGGHFYNQGVKDAQQVVAERLLQITEDLEDIEKVLD